METTSHEQIGRMYKNQAAASSLAGEVQRADTFGSAIADYESNLGRARDVLSLLEDIRGSLIGHSPQDAGKDTSDPVGPAIKGQIEANNREMSRLLCEIHDIAATIKSAL